MRFVEHKGDVYKISDRNYRVLLEHIIDGREWYLPQLGKRVAVDIKKITDLKSEEAAAILTNERGRT